MERAWQPEFLDKVVKFKETLLKNWRAKLLGAALIATLGAGFWSLSFTEGLTFFSYDSPFAFRAGIHPNQALVVYMDDESRKRLNQPVQGPWDRALHVQLINELFARGAKAVVFDVLFDEPWSNKEVDGDLAAAIKAHGHVVLGASIRYAGGDGQPVVGTFLHAVEPLGSAAPWGVAELSLDNDGTIRRHYNNEQYTNLSSQAALAGGFANADSKQNRWINYYGPAGTIPHVSYYQVLENGATLSDVISNRVVFVGMAPIINYQGSRSSDDFKTPYTRWVGANSPGVEIQATAFLNLARGDWLSRLPLPMELALILLSALWLAFILPVFRPGMAFLAGAMFALAATLAGIVLPLLMHEWFCWAVIPTIEVPVGLVWFSIFLLKRRTVEETSTIRIEFDAEELPANGQPQIPDHELIRFLARGGFGEVWLAKNTLGTFRAVKIVRRQTFESEKPFESEFRGIQAFEPISRSHEGFVDILQVGRRDKAGYFYYIMELADDQNTGRIIEPENYVPRTLGNEISKRGKIPCRECVDIAMMLALALHELHDSKLVHRDIKPANIIFVGGVPKLADIGLVVEMSKAETFVGTTGFLAPEGPGLPQADIFSFGKTLYEASMGRDRCAFPELPTEFAEDPEREALLELNEILLKACEISLPNRYGSAREMYADLQRLANRLKTTTEKPSEE
jgi:CHASE2 domain-containing sensor protein